MIEANELRIGNLIKHKSGVEVIEVKPYHFKYADIYEGIPLDEEWLLNIEMKHGFILNNTYDDDFKGYILYDDFVACCNGMNHYNELYYVHQLQNLYFALTGQELTIKN